MTKIIAIATQKGGACKTTTSLALALALKKKGFTTLLIDTDPQCNSSDTYRATIEGEATLYDILIEGTPANDVIQKTSLGDIIPCDRLLGDADSKITKMGKEYILKKAIQPIKHNYDYIIIDTPPSLGILLSNALTLADTVIIPVTTDRYALQGLADMQTTIGLIHEYTNPTLKVGGLLIARYNSRLNLGKEITDVMPEIAKNFKTVVFKTIIRESVAAREAQATRKSLYDHAPASTTAKDYMALAEEIMEVI